MVLPGLLRIDPRTLPASSRRELEAFRHRARETPAFQEALTGLVDALLPAGRATQGDREDELDTLLAEADRGQTRLLNIGYHLRICGRPARFAAFEQVLARLKGLGDKVFVSRRDDIARAFAQSVPA